MRRNSGAFIPFMAIAIIGLLALAGLAIDGARLFISVTQNDKIAKIAAQLAIREYATFIPPENTPSDQIHQRKIEHVNNQIALLLNDELNSVFGYSDSSIVKLAVSGQSFEEGLILTPGEYFISPEDIADTATRSRCAANSAGQGCWLPFQTGRGINSFRAEVKTPSTSVIKLILLKVLNDSTFRISSEAFSFLKPRIFLNLVDMSESITEENFNSFGRYRSKFMYRLAEGSSPNGGADCATQPGEITPRCTFSPTKDDQAWNGEFYSNAYGINDNRCELPGDPNCILRDEQGCVGSLYRYMWAFGHHPWEGLITGKMAYVPTCSPIFWSLPSSTTPCGRRTCFEDSSSFGGNNLVYRPYGYRFIGDTRPNLIFDTDGNSRQPHFFRFKDDYFNFSGSFKRASINADGEIVENNILTEGLYLVEDPVGIRNDSHDYYVREQGLSSLAPNFNYANGRPKDPEGYFRFDNCNGTQVVGEGHRSFSCSNRRGYLLPRLQPGYEGPEPYNSILKGLWYIHERAAEQNIPGDRFGALFFDSTLISHKAQVPLTPVLRTENTGIKKNPTKLKQLLDSIDPTAKPDFWDVRRIRGRLGLGLYPDPNAPETNIPHAISLAVKYLRNHPNMRGSDVYLNIFTDFLAFAHCDFRGGDVTDARIEDCANTTGLNSDKAQPNETTSQRVQGMINDLIGWPNSNGGRHKGLLQYLKDNGIKPILFAFNGTLGGEPIFPNPSGSGCLSRKDVRENTGNFDPPLPLAFGSNWDARTFWDPVLRASVPRFDYVLNRYRIQGGNGNMFLYTLGDLMNPAIQAGGDLIQLLSPCPNAIPEPGRPSAEERLNAYCNAHPVKGKTNDAGRPFPADTHFSRDDSGPVCKSYWTGGNNPNYPNQTHMAWGLKRMSIGIDCHDIDADGGVVLFNPITDYGDNGGTQLLWHHHCDPNNPAYDLDKCSKSTATTHGYAFPSHEERYTLWGLSSYTQIPRVDISHAGGLRCEPRTFKERPTDPLKPFGVDKQIEEKINSIVKEPAIEIVARPFIL